MAVGALIALTKNTNIMMMKKSVYTVGLVLMVQAVLIALRRSICMDRGQINVDIAGPLLQVQVVLIVPTENTKNNKHRANPIDE
jgi:hypothetical protein